MKTIWREEWDIGGIIKEKPFKIFIVLVIPKKNEWMRLGSRVQLVRRSYVAGA